MKTVLSIDIGTSSICALVLDAESQRTLCSQTLPNQAAVPGLPPNRHEQNPAGILETVERAVDAVMQHLALQGMAADSLRGIGVTGQMHGVLLLDREHSPRTNLITWRDQRSAESSRYNIASHDHTSARRCGCSLQAGYGAGTLSRLLELDPTLVAAGIGNEIKAVGIADFIVAKLCGRVVTDYSMAASWGCFDLRRQAWDQTVLAALDIPENIFPEVVPSASPCAALLPHYRQRWNAGAQTMVCAGVGDHQAGVLACGPLQQGSCIINMGTGGQVSVVRKGFVFVEGLETRPLTQDYFLLAGTSLCGGWSYAYLADFFCQVAQTFTQTALARSEAFAIMNDSGANAPGDGDGLRVDPCFLGSRAEQQRSGSIQGIDTRNLTPANLIRATLNGMVDELYGYQQRAALPVVRLYASGNAVRHNHLLRQAIAERWGMTPVISDESEKEEAALGAARLVAEQLGAKGKELFATG